MMYQYKLYVFMNLNSMIKEKQLLYVSKKYYYMFILKVKMLK